MTTAVDLAETRYMASDLSFRVNDGTPGSGAFRTYRVGHLIRGVHTLCGRHTSHFGWVQPDNTTRRCGDCGAIPDGHLTHHDMCSVGITYRQLDYWCRKGWLRPDEANTGSGTRRTFPPDELRVAALMAVLTREAGLRPDRAEMFARQGWLDLDGGVRLVLQ